MAVPIEIQHQWCKVLYTGSADTYIFYMSIAYGHNKNG